MTSSLLRRVWGSGTAIASGSLSLVFFLKRCLATPTYAACAFAVLLDAGCVGPDGGGKAGVSADGSRSPGAEPATRVNPVTAPVLQAAPMSNVLDMAFTPGPKPERMVVGDAVDRIERELALPRRWAAHKPNFRGEWRTFCFQHAKGPQERRWGVLLDGDRFVALCWGDSWHLAASDPLSAQREVRLPAGRYHMDTFVGPTLHLGSFIEPVDKNLPAEEQRKMQVRNTWIGGGESISLLRHQETTNRIVDIRVNLTLDPVFGYRMDVRSIALFASDPGEVRVANETVMANDKGAGVVVGGGTFCPGIYVPWPSHEIYDFTVYTHHGDPDGKFRGWASNTYCIDRCDAGSRELDRARTVIGDPGFFAYLARAPGSFSPVCTFMDHTGPRVVGQCNAGHGPAFSGKIGRAEPDGEGRYRMETVRRLMWLPPEARDYIRPRTQLQEEGAKGVFLRIGRKEGFEDQPLNLSLPTRGLIWTGGGPAIADNVAHTGRKSMRVEGRQWPNLPQVLLEPNTRYRLEGWFKVEPWSEADRAKRKKTEGALVPRAWIQGDLFEWSPHTGPMLVTQATSVACGTREWEHVVLDFTTPAWDPFINISLVSEQCTAYLDDFQLAPIQQGDDNHRR